MNRRWFYALGFLLVAAIHLSFVHSRPVYMSDTIAYMEAAKSLAAGDGYRTALMDPFVTYHTDRIDLVFTQGKTQVYRVKPRAHEIEDLEREERF